MTRTVHVVAHTHWDREWYRTFQSFRMELVELVDETLDLLERDPEYRHFMLDGQMAVIDDYLAIRPHQVERLATHARDGRLIMGPWHILMDEFLVSGETIIRDMQLGLQNAEPFGGAMEVGYLPDMFGHIAQMPQILNGFGFNDTVVWRGVPSEVTQHAAFTWSAPDGSSVVAQYLPRGYGNGAGLPPTAQDLVTRVALFTQQTAGRSGSDNDPVLWMHGTDHRHPLPQLTSMVAEANAIQSDWQFEVSSLPKYIAAQRAARATSHQWFGELRSGARANLLMGVGSNRVDVKIAAARSERALERLAEPLSAMLLLPDKWPGAFLDEAWHLMILNSAHDSICACSHDDVVDAVNVRFAEAKAIADGLIDRSMLAAVALGASLPGTATANVVNAAARTRSGLVELTVAEGAELPGTQLLRTTPATLPMATTTLAEAVSWIDIIEDHLGEVADVEIDDSPNQPLQLRLISDINRFGLLDTAPLHEQLQRLASHDPERTVHISISAVAAKTVLAYAHDVPGFGWQRWNPTEPAIPPVHATGSTLTNGILTVTVADDATFAINGHGGFGRLVDGGDKGDTYNWCPPDEDTRIDAPTSVAVTVVESGPLRAQLAITATYLWPKAIVRGQRTGEVETTVVTTLELRTGEDFVRVAVAFDNQSRDHRLRAHFPLVHPTTTSVAECAFATVSRGLTAEGGPTELGLATQPSRRFVTAGGVTICHEGLLEYELIDIEEQAGTPHAHTLALTLLRANGLLSQAPMQTRLLPAGPINRLDGPQMQGHHSVRYAVHIGDRNPYAVTDDAFLPLMAVGAIAQTESHLADVEPGSFLAVEGAEVSMLRRVHDDPTTLEVRVFNATDTATTVHIPGRSGHLVDLRGRRTGTFTDSFPLRPWGIQTLRVASS